MLIPRINVFISTDCLDRHWESYPFHASLGPIFERLLDDRGIRIVSRSCDADVIIQQLNRLGSQFNVGTISDCTPTVIIEGRDVLPPLNMTRQALNKHPNAVLWKWGVLNEYKYYNATQFVYAPHFAGKPHPVRGIDFNIDQLILAFNLCWHHSYSRNMPMRVKKSIDVAFCGSISESHCHPFKEQHRIECIRAIDKLPKSVSTLVYKKAVAPLEYFDILSRSRICISPWGNSEISGRDVQGFTHNCEIIRPKTLRFANTWPDMWSDAIECEPDFSDLEYHVTRTLDNWDEQTTNAKGEKWRGIISNYDILADRICNLLLVMVNGY